MIQEIDFEQIKKIWEINLWLGRKSKIESTSAINFDLSINLDFLKSKPTHLGYFLNDKCVAVISGHLTGTQYFRSRGLWVDPNHQRKGIAKKLINELGNIALSEGADFIWTLPRISSWLFYQKQGFIPTHESYKYEFGPHYLAVKALNALAQQHRPLETFVGIGK